GEFLPEDSAPSPVPEKGNNDWIPYQNRLEFELADFLFTRNQMPAAQIDTLLSIWAASLLQHGGQLLFTNHQDLYNTINSTPLGDIKWESFSIKYTGKQPITNTPPWMNDTYKVWFRDFHELVCSVLGNPNFANNMDIQPYREFEMATDQHRFINFMS
ncbi:hypothetical protein BDN67DRAFT_863097, partial [Paxillus ammoniavirescens]